MGRLRLLGLGLVLVAAMATALVPLYANRGVVFLVGVTLTEIVFAMSWAMLFARAGILVFGHAAFFLIGAYVVGYGLKSAAPIPFLPLFGLAVLAAGLAAFAMGVLVIGRLTGIAFAILTLALSEILRTLISSSIALGRDDGIPGIPRPTLELGFATVSLREPERFFWFILAVTLLTFAAMAWVTFGRFGRILFSIRQDAERTGFLGHDVRRYRIAALVVSAAFAGAAGALYAPWAQFVSPELGNVFHSVQPMLNTLLGGTGFFFGPALGAAVFAAIGYLTRSLLGSAELIAGAVLLAIVLLAPAGILGVIDLLRRPRLDVDA